MGPDKIKAYTYVEKLNIDYNSWFDSSFKDNKGNTINRFTFGKTEVMWLEYYPRSFQLMIRLNIPRLLYGDNMIPAMCFDFDILTQIVLEEVKDHPDLVTIFSSREFISNWTFSSVEYNIDIPLLRALIPHYISVTRKTRLPRKIVKEFGDDVISVYHQSSNNLKKSSVVFNAYDKLGERQNKTTPTTFAASISQTTLREDESLLRLEVRYKRSAVSYRTRSVMTTTSAGIDINVTTKNDPYIDRVIEALRYERQINEMKLLIKLYHLDKKVFTRLQLRSIINQQPKNADYKANVWKTIEYLNGTRKREPFTPETTSKHIKYILNLGCHYIYADIQLKPLSIEDALSRLPRREKESIRYYKILEASTGYSGYSGTKPSINSYTIDTDSNTAKPHIKIDIKPSNHKQPSTTSDEPTPETEEKCKPKISSVCSRNNIGKIKTKFTPKIFLSCYM